jgi:hypothetical protein
MKLNVSAVLAKEAERKAKPKPLLVVKVKPSFSKETTKVFNEVLAQVTSEVKADHQIAKIDLVNELEMERTRLLKQRAILSSKTANLVQEVAVKFRSESAGLEKEFMCGNLPSPELAAHYEKIEALTRQGAELYDKIEHAKMYGKLPTVEHIKILPSESIDESDIKYQIRRLDDSIYKKTNNIKNKRPKNPSRLSMWQEELAMAQAERNDLKLKLKSLQDEARAKCNTAE